MTTTNDNDLYARGEALLTELRALLALAPLSTLRAVLSALSETYGNPEQRQDDPAQNRPTTG